MLRDKRKNVTKISDIATPFNLAIKYAEKILKYRILVDEMNMMYKQEQVYIASILLGATR